MSKNIDQQMDASEHGVISKKCEPIHQSYSITIKPTFRSFKRKVIQDPDILKTQFRQICDNCGFIPKSYSIELDSLNVPHLHGIYKSDNPTFYPIKIKGWHIYTKLCYDEARWEAYIQKDTIKDIESNYSFIN